MGDQSRRSKRSGFDDGSAGFNNKERKTSKWDIPEPTHSQSMHLPQSPIQHKQMQHHYTPYTPQPGHAHPGYGDKKQRTLYVGNVKPDVSEGTLATFLERELTKVEGRTVTGPVIDKVTAHHDKMFAFVEFFHEEDADRCSCLDGVKLGGDQLRIRRPKNYVPTGPQRKWKVAGLLPSHVEDGPGKLFLGNIPPDMPEDEIQELVISTTGVELSAWSLARDRETGISKGFAFFSITDHSRITSVCKALHGMHVDGSKLICKPSNNTNNKNSNNGAGSAAHPDSEGGGGGGGAFLAKSFPRSTGDWVQSPPTRFLQLENLLTMRNFLDPDEYEDIILDVYAECRRFVNQKVRRVFIPRPHPAAHPFLTQELNSPSYSKDRRVGMVFVEFTDPEAARRACIGLHGRQFEGRDITLHFLSPEEWEKVLVIDRVY